MEVDEYAGADGQPTGAVWACALCVYCVCVVCSCVLGVCDVVELTNTLEQLFQLLIFICVLLDACAQSACVHACVCAWYACVHMLLHVAS